MRPLSAVLLALVLLLAGGCLKEGRETANAPAPWPVITHTVIKGDTLSAIARLYGVDVSVIVEANGLTDRELTAGRRLSIPGGTMPAPSQPRPSPAVVDKDWFRPRAEWTAERIDVPNTKAMAKPFRITVHHSGNHDDVLEPARKRLPQIERFHRIQQWACIGYHFVIDRGGEVWEGRPMIYQGAHAQGDENNRGNIGVCLLGNFNFKAVPAAQRDALVTVLNRLRATYGIERGQVWGHSHFKVTDCPGRSLQSVVNAYRASAGARGGAARPTAGANALALTTP